MGKFTASEPFPVSSARFRQQSATTRPQALAETKAAGKNESISGSGRLMNKLFRHG